MHSQWVLCCIHANPVNVLHAIMLRNIAPAQFNYCRKLCHSCYQYMVSFSPWYRFPSKQLLWGLISSCSLFFFALLALSQACRIPKNRDPSPFSLMSQGSKGDRWQCVVFTLCLRASNHLDNDEWASSVSRSSTISRCKLMNGILDVLDGGWSNKTFPITCG